MKLILNPEYGLYEKGGKAFCDSLQVAETFERRHNDILRDIRHLLNDADTDFGLRNFAQTDDRDSQKKKQPKYIMTKDGFSLLTFGFTGKKAMEFKIAYINRFNAMETFIESLAATKVEFPAFTEAIMLSHDEPKHYHYSNEINMIYRIVIGMDAKAFRQSHGLDADAGIKPFLPADQIAGVELLQRVDIGLIEAGLTYEQRKEALARRYQRSRLRLLA
jgi:Rha family phage regulatory protein